MPKSFIIFNGQSSAKFGVTIEELPQSSHAERRAEPYQIAGRNGSFVREDGTFENYEQAYTFNTRNITIDRNAYQTSCDIATWLLGSSGYCRLEDTYEPECYRLARFAGPFNVESILHKYGRGTIVFDCQPERYLKTGEQPILAPQAFLSSADGEFSIANPTAFAAEPVINVVGSGIVHFKIETDPGTPWTTFLLDLGSVIQGITIDCKTYKMTAGDGSDFSSHATIASSDGYKTLPKLLGTTNIRKLSGSGNLQGLAITPRWWTI